VAETRLSVQQSALNWLGDSTNTNWTNAEVQNYIQEGYDRLVLTTECLWTKDYLDDVAGTATYTLPGNCTKIDRVTWNWRRLPAATFSELSRIDREFRTTQGQPLTFSNDSDGLLTLRKYPIPSATATAGADTNNTRIEYFKRGAALSVDGSGFDIPDRYVKYVKWFAIFRCLERNGSGQDLKMAAHFKARYDAGVMRMLKRRELIRKSQTIRLGGSRRQRQPVELAKPPWNYGRPMRYS
jgi:hypothetical protein